MSPYGPISVLSPVSRRLVSQRVFWVPTRHPRPGRRAPASVRWLRRCPATRRNLDKDRSYTYPHRRRRCRGRHEHSIFHASGLRDRDEKEQCGDCQNGCHSDIFHGGVLLMMVLRSVGFMYRRRFGFFKSWECTVEWSLEKIGPQA